MPKNIYNKKKNRLKLICIFVFIMIYWIFIHQSFSLKKDLIDEQKFHISSKIRTNYNYIVNDFYNDCKNNIKEGVSNNREIMKQFYLVANSSVEKQDGLKKELYELLTPFYSRMKNRGVAHLQFVSKENISFLRMHRPTISGDDLSSFRDILKEVNRTGKDRFGFEQGRTVHAYRYAFALFYNNEHIGALEISLDSKYLQEKLQRENIYSHFLIDKKNFNSKIFLNDTIYSRYTNSVESGDYLRTTVEADTLIDRDKEIIFTDVARRSKKAIGAKLKTKRPFALSVRSNNRYNVIDFLPVKDINGITSAYLVSCVKSDYIGFIHRQNNIINILVFVILMLLCYFIYINLRKNIKLKLEVGKLNKVQSISHIGLLELEIQNEHLSLSDELYEILKLDKKKDHIKDKKSFISLLKELIISPNKLIDILDDYDKHNGSFPVKLLFKDGTIKYVQLLCEKFEHSGENDLLHCTVQDITEKELLKLENTRNEKLISEQSKMALLGEMLENIAHQWRQPLSVISSLASGLQVKVEHNLLKTEEIDDSMEQIVETTEYLSQTIDDFREFLNKNKKPEEFDIKESYKKSIKLLSSKLKNRKILLVEEKIENTPIKGDKNEMIQVFMNILSNAIYVLERNDEGERLIFVKILKKRDYINIKLKDSGGGIPKDIIKKVFEPYFTTKGEKEGTGIGLFMSYKIIKKLRGDIKVKNSVTKYDNKKYKGALFIIKIPLEK